MLPLALVVVVLGGTGSLAGAFAGSFVIGFVYTFGHTILPDLAYVVQFLPMAIVLVARPGGLFRASPT
jgi:branched-chain amino acid transport system permease protein